MYFFFKLNFWFKDMEYENQKVYKILCFKRILGDFIKEKVEQRFSQPLH